MMRLAAQVSVLLSISVTSAPLVAVEVEVAPPASVGLDADALGEITRRLEEEVRAGRIAGAVGLIARHGRVAYLEAVGRADLDRDEPMATDALFRIASMTKAVTSVAVMMLVEEGALSLSDSLAEHLPEFAEARVLIDAGSGSSDAGSGSGDTTPAATPVTLHHLLTHTSGITYGWTGTERLDALYREAELGGIFLPTDDSLESYTRRLATVPLAFEPGAAWHYGLSVDVLGRVVEVVSGLSLDRFFEERIFRPLGMRDTWLHVPEDQRGRLAALYTTDADGGLRRVGSEPVTAGFLTFSGDYCHAGAGTFHSGGGGLVSTAPDYARFLGMLLGGGELDGTRLLARETVELMTSHRIGDLSIPPMEHGDGFGYGFGVLTERGIADDRASVGTYSWGGIFNTFYWVDPQERLVGILMTQLFPFDHLTTRSDFKRLAYAAIDDAGFERVYAYEKGVEHANPFFNARQLRVNSPEASTHPEYSTRSEPRSSGLARILIDEDLRTLRRASLECEIWGGHPGTREKRVGVNGRALRLFPEVGTAAGHCTHQYPRFALRPVDLVRGYNALQFACDQGSSFWGHYIVDDARLVVAPALDDARLAEAGLAGFSARVEASPSKDGETIALRLRAAPEDLERIAEVAYEGRFVGYDENGDGWSSGWHGMTKGREPYGVLGRSGSPPFEVDWDVSLLPAQPRVAVRARLRFRDDDSLRYTTPVLGGLAVPSRERERVTRHAVRELPVPFWSRDGRAREAVIDLDVDPGDVVRAELHVVAWTGGAGGVDEYFTLNGTQLPIAEGSGHEVVYSTLAVDPSTLRRGENALRLLSDTDHHGIELLLPGPVLFVRSRTR